jgi:hypothetical protein
MKMRGIFEMKKLGMLLVLFSLSVFTVGCGQGDGTTDTGADDATVQPEDGAGVDEPVDTMDATDTTDTTGTTDANGG